MDERHESDTQTESCRQCGDTGWMIEADRGTRRAQRCECWAVRQAAAMVEAAGIPERYANCSFDNFTSTTTATTRRQSGARASLPSTSPW